MSARMVCLLTCLVACLVTLVASAHAQEPPLPQTEQVASPSEPAQQPAPPAAQSAQPEQPAPAAPAVAPSEPPTSTAPTAVPQAKAEPAPQPTDAPATWSTSADAEPSSPPPPPAAPPSTGPQPGFALGAGIAGGVLNLPNLGIAPSLWTRLTPRGWWPIELSVDWWLDNEAELDFAEEDLLVHPLYGFAYPAEGSRLVVRMYELSVATCPYRLRLSAGDMRLCGGFRGGAMRVKGEGFAPATDETRVLFSAQVYARWLFRIGGPVRIGYSLGLAVPFVRPRFGYIDRFGTFQEKFQQAPVGGRLDLILAAEL